LVRKWAHWVKEKFDSHGRPITGHGMQTSAAIHMPHPRMRKSGHAWVVMVASSTATVVSHEAPREV
jgi:hypothetical protein